MKDSEILKAIAVPASELELDKISVYHGTVASEVESVLSGPKNWGKGFGGSGLYLAINEEKDLAEAFATIKNQFGQDKSVVLCGTLNSGIKYDVASIKIVRNPLHEDLSKGIFSAEWAKNKSLQQLIHSNFDLIEVKGAADAGLAINSNRFFVMTERPGVYGVKWQCMLEGKTGQIKSLPAMAYPLAPLPKFMPELGMDGKFRFTAKIGEQFGKPQWGEVVGECTIIPTNGTQIPGVITKQEIKPFIGKLSNLNFKEIGKTVLHETFHTYEILHYTKESYDANPDLNKNHPKTAYLVHFTNGIGTAAITTKLWCIVTGYGGKIAFILLSTCVAVDKMGIASDDSFRRAFNNLGGSYDLIGPNDEMQAILSDDEKKRNIELYDNPWGEAWLPIEGQSNELSLSQMYAREPDLASAHLNLQVLGYIGSWFNFIEHKAAKTVRDTSNLVLSAGGLNPKPPEIIPNDKLPPSTVSPDTSSNKTNIKIEAPSISSKFLNPNQSAEKTISSYFDYKLSFKLPDNKTTFSLNQTPQKTLPHGTDVQNSSSSPQQPTMQKTYNFEPPKSEIHEKARNSVPKLPPKLPPKPKNINKIDAYFAEKGFSLDFGIKDGALGTFAAATWKVGFEAIAENAMAIIIPGLASIAFLIYTFINYEKQKEKHEMKMREIKREGEEISRELELLVGKCENLNATVELYVKESDPIKKAALYDNLLNQYIDLSKDIKKHTKFFEHLVNDKHVFLPIRKKNPDPDPANSIEIKMLKQLLKILMSSDVKDDFKRTGQYARYLTLRIVLQDIINHPDKINFYQLKLHNEIKKFVKETGLPLLKEMADSINQMNDPFINDLIHNSILNGDFSLHKAMDQFVSGLLDEKSFDQQVESYADRLPLQIKHAKYLLSKTTDPKRKQQLEEVITAFESSNDNFKDKVRHDVLNALCFKNGPDLISQKNALLESFNKGEMTKEEFLAKDKEINGYINASFKKMDEAWDKIEDKKSVSICMLKKSELSLRLNNLKLSNECLQRVIAADPGSPQATLASQQMQYNNIGILCDDKLRNSILRKGALLESYELGEINEEEFKRINEEIQKEINDLSNEITRELEKVTDKDFVAFTTQKQTELITYANYLQNGNKNKNEPTIGSTGSMPETVIYSEAGILCYLACVDCINEINELNDSIEKGDATEDQIKERKEKIQKKSNEIFSQIDSEWNNSTDKKSVLYLMLNKAELASRINNLRVANESLQKIVDVDTGSELSKIALQQIAYNTMSILCFEECPKQIARKDELRKTFEVGDITEDQFNQKNEEIKNTINDSFTKFDAEWDKFTDKKAASRFMMKKAELASRDNNINLANESIEKAISVDPCFNKILYWININIHHNSPPDKILNFIKDHLNIDTSPRAQSILLYYQGKFENNYNTMLTAFGNMKESLSADSYEKAMHLHDCMENLSKCHHDECEVASSLGIRLAYHDQLICSSLDTISSLLKCKADLNKALTQVKSATHKEEIGQEIERAKLLINYHVSKHCKLYLDEKSSSDISRIKHLGYLQLGYDCCAQLFGEKIANMLGFDNLKTNLVNSVVDAGASFVKDSAYHHISLIRQGMSAEVIGQLNLSDAEEIADVEKSINATKQEDGYIDSFFQKYAGKILISKVFVAVVDYNLKNAYKKYVDSNRDNHLSFDAWVKQTWTSSIANLTVNSFSKVTNALTAGNFVETIYRNVQNGTPLLSAATISQTSLLFPYMSTLLLGTLDNGNDAITNWNRIFIGCVLKEMNTGWNGIGYRHSNVLLVGISQILFKCKAFEKAASLLDTSFTNNLRLMLLMANVAIAVGKTLSSSFHKQMAEHHIHNIKRRFDKLISASITGSESNAFLLEAFGDLKCAIEALPYRFPERQRLYIQTLYFEHVLNNDFEMRLVPRDNNGFFSAVAYYTRETREELRQKSVAHIRNNQHLYERLIAKEDGEVAIQDVFDAYCSSMSKEGTEVDKLAIRALTSVLNRPIIIIFDGILNLDSQGLGTKGEYDILDGDPIFVSYDIKNKIYNALLIRNELYFEAIHREKVAAQLKSAAESKPAPLPPATIAEANARLALLKSQLPAPPTTNNPIKDHADALSRLEKLKAGVSNASTQTGAACTKPVPSLFFKPVNDYPFNMIEKKFNYVNGDCFFDAFIANDPKHQITDKMAARKAIGNECRQNQDKYINRHGVSNILDFCNKIETAREWVDMLAIEAFSKAYKVCIVTINKGIFANPNQGSTKQTKVARSYEAAAMATTIFGLEFADKSKDSHPVILGYEGQGILGHYVPLSCPPTLTLTSGETHALNPLVVMRNLQKMRIKYLAEDPSSLRPKNT